MSPHIIICNDFGSVNGGAAKVAISSAIGLSALGYEVIYFCGVGPIDPDLKKRVSKVVCLGLNDILNDSSRLKAMSQGIWNRIAEKEMDKLLKNTGKNTIVHVHGWTKCLSSAIIKACHKNNIKPYISIHDYFAACPNGGFYNYKKEEICELKGICLKCLFTNCDSRNYANKLWRFIRQIIQDKNIRNSDDITYIGTSYFSYNVIRDSLKSKNVKWVKNPISIYKGSFVKCEENDYYLFVGRLSKEKGVDLFCEAMKKTESKGIVIGSGNEIEAYKRDYMNVEFVGWKNTEDMMEYINKTRALVVSSRYYEGAPLIVPEMQCYGIPCIVPDRCAASDTIKDGFNGIIFKSGDLDSLCEAIEKVKRANVASSLFNPDTWDNEYVTMDMHISNLIKAYGVEENESTLVSD